MSYQWNSMRDGTLQDVSCLYKTEAINVTIKHFNIQSLLFPAQIISQNSDWNRQGINPVRHTYNNKKL